MDDQKQLMILLEDQARSLADGHLTVMRFTTNWRIIFGTPRDRADIAKGAEGQTFEQAARKALANPKLYRN